MLKIVWGQFPYELSSQLLFRFCTINMKEQFFWSLWQNGATPLHYAAQVGALQTVKLLMKYQVDLNVADNVSVFKVSFSVEASYTFTTS